MLGRKFIVSTDQKSLKQLLQQRVVTAEQQNWSAKLLGYDFEIVYKPGNLNRGADALSRVNEEGGLCQIHTRIQWEQEEIVKREAATDPQLQQIIKDLQIDETSRPGYEFRQGVLLYEGRLVLSKHSSFLSNTS